MLFLVPGLLGIVHVLFGLQMFKMLLSDPYDQIWLPFAIFVALYAVYYLLTVWLYTNIVLKIPENNKHPQNEHSEIDSKTNVQCELTLVLF